MFWLARIGRIFQAPVIFYDNALRSNPIFTKCITSGAMYMGGDMIAQYAEVAEIIQAIFFPDHFPFTIL